MSPGAAGGGRGLSRSASLGACPARAGCWPPLPAWRADSAATAASVDGAAAEEAGLQAPCAVTGVDDEFAPDRLRAAFKVFDVNDDGKIDAFIIYSKVWGELV